MYKGYKALIIIDLVFCCKEINIYIYIPTMSLYKNFKNFLINKN